MKTMHSKAPSLGQTRLHQHYSSHTRPRGTQKWTPKLQPHNGYAQSVKFRLQIKKTVSNGSYNKRERSHLI